MKRVANKAYIHVSALGELPQGLRRRVDVAAARVPKGWSLARIDLKGRGVMLGWTESWETEAHPQLLVSRLVIPGKGVKVTDYRKRGSRPVYHRKESMVSKDHPQRAEFAALSAAEAKVGLLGRSDIGGDKAWARALKTAGYKVVGHELVKVGKGRGSRRGRRPATPEEAAWAATWAGDNDPDVPAKDLDWFATDDYGARRLRTLMPGSDWKGWWAHELQTHTDGGMPGYLPALQAAWIESPQERVVIVEDAQGRPEGIWDGWHRAAISILNRARLPALVGRRRTVGKGRGAVRDNLTRTIRGRDDGEDFFVKYSVVPAEEACVDLSWALTQPMGPDELGVDYGDLVLLISFVQIPQIRSGYGWGRRFVTAAEKWGREQGARVAALYASPTSASWTHPRGFWEATGYRAVAGLQGLGGKDAIMVKTLEPRKGRSSRRRGRGAQRTGTRIRGGKLFGPKVAFDAYMTTLGGAISDVDESIAAFDEELFVERMPPGFSGDEPALYITLLNVPKKARGRGWGRRFARTLENHGRARGAQAVVLLAASVDDQGPSYDFWTKQGFEVLAETEDGWGDPVAAMWKRLEPGGRAAVVTEDGAAWRDAVEKGRGNTKSRIMALLPNELTHRAGSKDWPAHNPDVVITRTRPSLLEPGKVSIEIRASRLPFHPRPDSVVLGAFAARLLPKGKEQKVLERSRWLAEGADATRAVRARYDCTSDWRGARQAGVKRLAHVTDARLELGLRNRGLGRVGYEAMLAWAARHGAALAPARCIGLSTSLDADRVWKALVRDLPHAGTIVWLPEALRAGKGRGNTPRRGRRGSARLVRPRGRRNASDTKTAKRIAKAFRQRNHDVRVTTHIYEVGHDRERRRGSWIEVGPGGPLKALTLAVQRMEHDEPGDSFIYLDYIERASTDTGGAWEYVRAILADTAPHMWVYGEAVEDLIGAWQRRGAHLLHEDTAWQYRADPRCQDMAPFLIET